VERFFDRLGPLRTRLGLVIVAGVLMSDAAAVTAVRLGFPLWLAALGAAVLALVFVRLMARGLTRPLREMAAASRALASGHTGAQVGHTERTDEIGELARAFNAMSADLAEVDRQRRDLVANVSHELRTPLSALHARLENVADGVEPADAETVRTMLAQVRRLGRLVEQLLDLSRLESQEAPFDAEPFAVAGVLEEVAREARLSAPEDVVLRVEAADGLVVSGDAERVHQVVMNLVENAVRHSPRPGTVLLTAAPLGGSVRIDVVDQGPGIPEEESARVFERFYRADRARSGGGAGLGLAIARWIVDLHGGSIRAEQAGSRGCRMVVELPGAA
jgi:signal transduction histidine kinase